MAVPLCGTNGIVVPPGGDSDALRAAIERLCYEPELRTQMGIAARDRAEFSTLGNYLINLARIYRALGDYGRSRHLITLEALAATTF
jgi:glycosyltransferase involved in cell wall biosynthesis